MFKIRLISVDHMVISSFIMVDQYKLLTKAITMLAQCQHLNLHIWLFFRYHRWDGCGDAYFQCRLAISRDDREGFFLTCPETRRENRLMRCVVLLARGASQFEFERLLILFRRLRLSDKPLNLLIWVTCYWSQ